MLPPNYFLCAFLTEAGRSQEHPSRRPDAPRDRRGAAALLAVLAILPWLHLPPR
jgi:hypothetical protein